MTLILLPETLESAHETRSSHEGTLTLGAEGVLPRE